ncbi:MAG TPA: ribosome biogenesis GTPase Der [Candidatus Binatia bacterium]|nr:ribosome biogenesis GTPase Der [Candidatus Binatia bacterium]
MTAAGPPRVALVGRPNVGKSTLFNRLVRARRAIVDDTPGVTRDRVVAPAEHGGRSFLCVDTGGFFAEPADPGTLAAAVRAQALAAVEEADVVVCVFDVTAGLAPADREMARLLARSGRPVLWVVNKVDTPAREALLSDFYAVGVERLLPVSGEHGRGLEALRDAIVAALPPAGAPAGAAPGTRLALVGRPNVGKSSLLNRLLGAERVIVAPQAGTTRDAVDTPLVVAGVPYVLVDTAGIRRRARVEDRVERHGAVRALGALARADVALVVLDAAEGMTDQDARIVARAWEAGRAVVLVANKWDTVPATRRDAAAFRRTLAEQRPAFARLPLLCVSARTGEGLADLFRLVARVDAAHARTLPTAALNRALAAAVAATPPPSPGGRALRFFYATQVGRRPPAVVVFTNAPAAVPPAYVRYLTARLSEAFRLDGVPLRLTLRARREGALSATPGRGSGRRTPRSSARARAGGPAPRR